MGFTQARAVAQLTALPEELQIPVAELKTARKAATQRSPRVGECSASVPAASRVWGRSARKSPYPDEVAIRL